MAALCNRQAIIFCLWFFSSIFFYLSFFPRLISAAAGLMSTVLDAWCGPSANLECRSERCCTRLAAKAGPKKSPKSGIWESSHNFVGLYIFAAKACIDNRKKNLLSSSISSTCSHNMVNFGPLAAEIVSLVWGTPGNFNEFRALHYCTAL